MGNPTDALDASQEALIAIVRGLSSFDGHSAFTTWSYRVATNACLDELRRQRRRSTTELDDTEPPGVDAGAPSLADSVADRLDVDAALQAVPVEFRAAVVLRDVCGLDYAEIAEVLAIPPGTVRSRIARGRAVIARRLGGNQSVPPDRLNPSP
jgi:RNA polymerase sigma-70 factor, ECF subfamily